MKSDEPISLNSADKADETVYKIQTFTEKLSAEKVKSCIEKIVLKKISTIDYASEK